MSVGSFALLDEFTAPVHQEQIAAEQIVPVSIPQILEQLVEGVKEIPQERYPEQTVKQIVDDPVPPIVEETAEVVLPSHAAPIPVSEHVALARDVAFLTPEIFQARCGAGC